MKLGATGQFPQGKIAPEDEGELVIAAYLDSHGLVHINFGKPIKWLGLDPPTARSLGAKLLALAQEAEITAHSPTQPQ